MKRYDILYIIMCVLLIASCQEDDLLQLGSLSPEQRALIGTAVNFNPSMAEPFAETRTTYNHDGRFNEGDIMQIYRQYWGTTDWEATQAFRTYSFQAQYAPGTSIALGTDWKVCVGRKKCDDWNPATSSGTTSTQTAADSLTWDNGRTVRFRAWSRSNAAGCISGGSASNYYPDYCIADWVTVSGPTTGIPLTLRHICSRVAFTCKAGNQFAGGEICLNKEDYMWNDNADSHEHDVADKLTEAEAEEVVRAVNAVYNRMCMPAGVNIETGTLRTMTTTLYEDLKANSKFDILEQATDGIVDYNTMTAANIATNVKHPTFSNVDGRLYMMSIPYDMSNEVTQGEVLVIPAKTRFRIKLRDVNNGDHDLSTGGYEYKEHIFALSDIKDGNGNTKYPNGLELVPGRSYLFTVGYLYDQLTVTVIEEGIQWSDNSDVESGEATDQHVDEASHTPYKWYQDAIKSAILETKQSKDYNPIFHISSAEEFKEFIALVNGTAATKTTGLARAQRKDDNPEADKDLDDKDSRRYWWYDVEATKEKLASEFPDTVWVTRADAELQGYVFYRHYFPQISDKAAYSIEDYVRGPVSFYDEQVDLHLVVQLTQDIDLHDWRLESIGNAPTRPFMGFFDGGTHTLSNVFMREQYLFGYMQDGEIRDLRITSTHPLALLNEAITTSSMRTLRLVGISLKADCTVSPIAQRLTGTSYVVGCIHEGDAGGALIGTADKMTMYGCMHASSNITGAALMGSYPNSSNQYLAGQAPKAVLQWSNFMCNYYQKSPDQLTRAIGDITDAYRPQEYIRGAHQHILRAKNDNLIGNDVDYDRQLSDRQKEEFYGLAPWKAMNYAIWKYNQLGVATGSEYHSFPESHLCHMVYEVDDIGYAHLYPELVPASSVPAKYPNGVATNEGVKNILYLNN